MGKVNPYEEINKNRKFCNNDLYDEVAEELGVDVELVKDIISTNSEFTVSIIRQGAFESLTYPYLGKIKARLRSVQKAASKVNRP